MTLLSIAAALTLSAPAMAQEVSWTAYDALLKANVSSQGVSYFQVGAEGLDPVVEMIAAADMDGLNHKQKVALYINAYNALTVDLIADELAKDTGLDSIMKLDGGKVWDTRQYTVAGQSLTLSDIENKKLRTMTDGRVHAALNCASKGCPPLLAQAFTADNLEQQLESASRAWVKTNAVVINHSKGTVKLSKIFDWYGEDFAAAFGPRLRDIPGVEGKQEAAINFIIKYSGPSEKAYLEKGGYMVSWNEYDWDLNLKK